MQAQSASTMGLTSSQSATPLQALQSMDSQQCTMIGSNHISPSPRLGGGEFNFHVSENHVLDKRTTASNSRGVGKLCMLLTQTNSTSDYDLFSRSSSVESNTSGIRDGKMGENSVVKSPADSFNQSPQSGPGQSPPDKPQSTTQNDDNDNSSTSKSELQDHNNFILKQLLSQEDDGEDDTDSKSGTDTSSKDGSVEMEKNEAEAKKPSNVLLKVSTLEVLHCRVANLQ